MSKTLIKPRLLSDKLKQNPKPQIENFQSQLPASIRSFMQNILSGKFLVFK